MSVDPALRPIMVCILEACRMTGIGRSKLCALIKAGDIPTIKVERIPLVRIKGLEGFSNVRASTEMLMSSGLNRYGPWRGNGPFLPLRTPVPTSVY